ncbi:zinc finger matrin-type protein 3-like [Phlebotomus argentipes]|uniref:zinc finger matrin-type protein 3-like n=1 Tax=Phlebotomus argentipes TaxID=94469 RepID=UPI0028933D52|nr:zinc finger matrin-type protein 3-like [Phlebotomus argentipes]
MNAKSSFTGEYNYPQYNANFRIPLKIEESAEIAPFSSVLDNIFEQQNTPERFQKLTVASLQRPAKRKNDEAPVGMEVDADDGQEESVKRRRMANALIEMLGEDFPAELKALMKPLCCDLCSVKLNSVSTANMHYESKNHEKKINNWLLEWSKKTGQPVRQRQKANKEGPVGPNAFHCDVCDIPLTSLQHARTHYTGRKHNLAASGRGQPSGAGFYNTDGKWVRQMTKPSQDPSGRFGIGEAFVKPPPVASSSQGSFCSLCSISVSSESQMKIHLEGAKHSKRLKASTAATIPPSDNDTVMESVIQQLPNSIPPKRDISINRTPSGNYYCASCDVTVNNEHLFNQHLNSKRHMKKLKMSQA